MEEECIICSCSGSKLAQCKVISSWTTLYRAAVIQNHNRFWRLQLKANFTKVPSNIIAIAELSSPTREICKPTKSHLMMYQQELPLEEAIEMEFSQTRRFCQINSRFAKRQSTSQTRRPERSFTVYKNFAPMT